MSPGRIAEVRPGLRRRVTQPHGLYIPGYDECVVGAVAVVREMDGCVQGIGEAVAEHPRQLGVGQQPLYPHDFGLHAFGHETALLQRRSLRHKLLRLQCTNAAKKCYNNK